MFKVTSSAASTLSSVRAASGVPETYGARFALADADAPSGGRLAVSFVDKPVQGDTVIEQDGFSVFVAPEVAQALPDGTLDAKPVDGETKLVLER